MVTGARAAAAGSGPRAWTALALVGLAAIAAVLLPALDLAADGRILHWHIGQTGFRHGVFELAVLGLALYALTGVRSPWAGVAALALCWLYLRRHHVDLPALVAAMHLEMLVALGAGAMRSCGSAPGTRLHGLLVPFVVGVALWLLLCIALSLAGWAAPGDLKLAAGMMLIVALPWGRTTPATLRAWRALRRQSGLARVIAVAMLVVLLGWLARTNNVTGYDSLWYGLRPQHVLAPNGSFFEPLGLVSPVYYFPKAYELLLAPLVAFRDVSYPFGFGVGVLGLFGIALWRLARSFGVPHLLALAGTLAAMTIPAVGNTAVSMKTDVIAGLFMLVALHSCWRAVRQHRSGPLCIALACLALASACKLIVLPYAAALALGTGAAFVAGKRGRAAGWQAPARFDIVVLLLAVTAALAVHARTWWLTGIPTIGPEPLVAIWRWFGMEMREPVGTLAWLKPQDWADVPALAREMLLAPARLPHIIVSWTGNVWLWLLLGSAFVWLVRTRGAPATARCGIMPAPLAALLAPILMLGLYLAVGIGHMFRGGDGNYLVIPVAVAMLAGLAMAAGALRGWHAGRTVVAVLLLGTAGMQFAFSLANSHWGEVGTRPLDLDLRRSTFDTKHLRDRALSRGGADDIAAALADAPADFRVIGWLDESATGYWLPVRYEHADSIGYSRPEYLQTAEGFMRFLALARIDALIVPRDADELSRVHDGARHALPGLRADPRARVTNGQRYALIDVSGLQAQPGSP
jgi:hypothetical protein